MPRLFTPQGRGTCASPFHKFNVHMADSSVRPLSHIARSQRRAYHLSDHVSFVIPHRLELSYPQQGLGVMLRLRKRPVPQGGGRQVPEQLSMLHVLCGPRIHLQRGIEDPQENQTHDWNIPNQEDAAFLLQPQLHDLQNAVVFVFDSHKEDLRSLRRSRREPRRMAHISMPESRGIGC